MHSLKDLPPQLNRLMAGMQSYLSKMKILWYFLVIIVDFNWKTNAVNDCQKCRRNCISIIDFKAHGNLALLIGSFSYTYTVLVMLLTWIISRKPLRKFDAYIIKFCVQFKI